MLIAPNSENLFDIVNTPQKIITISSIYFAKTILEFKVFENSKICSKIYG